jgi:hypothetical protein
MLEQVLCPIIVEYEDAIYIYHQKKIGEGPQYTVHQSHESCWRIFQTKVHDYPFKKTLFGLESSLPYTSIFYWDLVVARLHFNLVEKLGFVELVKKVVNSVNWVLVPKCDFF